MISISLFISDVIDNIGMEAMKNFFIGKYHKPIEEERIFMFLDMNSSTAIAEKLGHLKYFELLNQYYSDISEAIIQSSGEIYQYAGDEVVVSWQKDRTNNNWILCFTNICDIFKKESNNYISAFGLVPGFKAGFHFGKVTTGEIGVIKKEIIFTGDVLNTTARIQGKCKSFNVDNLISEDLVNITSKNSHLKFKEIGECELRGRDAKIRLYTYS
jgi:adenylate cyclase